MPSPASGVPDGDFVYKDDVPCKRFTSSTNKTLLS